MKNIILAAILSITPCFASSPEVLKSYLVIQVALAADSMKGVPAAAAKIAKGTKVEKLKAAAEILAKDNDLEAARIHFKAVSKPMVEWAVTTKPKGIDRATCPMTEEGHWLQKKGPIRNPYYGSTMLECGLVQQ